jgi:hypothetical protein
VSSREGNGKKEESLEDSATSAERGGRCTSRESRRSSEGRQCALLSSVFPEVQHHQIGVDLLNDVAEESLETVKDILAAKQVIQMVPR